MVDTIAEIDRYWRMRWATALHGISDMVCEFQSAGGDEHDRIFTIWTPAPFVLV